MAIAIGERFALDEFQDQRLHMIRFFETVNRGDVRMVQRGEHLRFAREARKAVGIERTFRGQDLDRDVAMSVSYRVRGTPRPCRQRRCA